MTAINAITPTLLDPVAELIERVVIKGDLRQLTPEQKGNFYFKVCESLGLNPLTKPFAYITLNGKEVLYALRDCTDQLRSIHRVSVEELNESQREGIFIVTAKVRNAQGRTDVATGAVSITGLKGEALANALMKAETKAKRRATLSICGLALLDETEISDIMDAAKEPRAAPVAAPLKIATPVVKPAPAPAHDQETGEVADDDPTWESNDPDAPDAPASQELATDHIARLDAELATAASEGSAALKEAWQAIGGADQKVLKSALDRRHKPAATKADRIGLMPT